MKEENKNKAKYTELLSRKSVLNQRLQAIDTAIEERKEFLKHNNIKLEDLPNTLETLQKAIEEDMAVVEKAVEGIIPQLDSILSEVRR